ncbi:uncharacterized protein PG986_013379 [Apiospora aurea]|uniref:Uncharacterized protein n=1 Tax=Apiospora aurea TaxID=335848 RepID=A0ABR1PVD7_9PEZI
MRAYHRELSGFLGKRVLGATCSGKQLNSLVISDADGGMGAPAPVADPTPMDAAPDLSGEPAALPPRSANIEERDLASDYDDQLEARDIDTEDSGGLEKRAVGVAVVAAVVDEEVSPRSREELPHSRNTNVG